MSQEKRKQLGRFLMEALELDDEARLAYLERMRAEDAEMAAQLEAMLVVEDGMETDFLIGSAAEEIGAPEPSWNAPARDPLETGLDLTGGAEPRFIGPYRLLEVLGTGGMGEVFLAEQKEPLERLVALKRVRDTFRDEAARSRFEAERRMLQRLEHPNIARILDAGTTDDGYPFFALEVVAGEPLDRYCNQRGLGVRQRLELMIAVCRGVQHAHRKRIIHRDLKPTNILVSEIDGVAVPKIIDFGVSQSLDRRGQEADDAAAYGTPAFMSPEELSGSGDIDTRADVYSLGVVLYQLVTGCRPFDATSFDELVDQVSKVDPPAPSTRLSTSVDRQTAMRIAEERSSTRLELMRTLRGDLRHILLKAVARDVEQRYGSVAVLADDLENLLHHRPISARPSSLTYRGRLWLRRHRWPTVAAAVLILAASGLLVQAQHARARTEQLTRAGQELTRHIERVEWRLRVAHLLPRQDLSPEIESIRSGMASLREQIPELYAGNRAMAQYALGRAALSLGELEDAHRHLESAWQQGYRRPEAALALGQVLGLLYEDQLDALARVTDRATREAMRQRAEGELRNPALELLDQAQSDAQSEAQWPELLQARIAYYQDELDRALQLSRDAAVGEPAHYEARFLEARILQRLAGQGGLERREVLDLLDRAEVAALAGLTTARSSPEGHLRLCLIRANRANFLARFALEGIDEATAASLEACGHAKEVLPSLVDADLGQGTALLAQAEVVLWDHHQDPAPPLEALERSLDGRLESEFTEAQKAEAVKLLGLAQNLRAVYTEQQGGDPRPVYQRAIEHFRDSLRLGGPTHQVHRELANALARIAAYEFNRGFDPGDAFELAEKNARAAVELAPDEATAHGYLGNVLLTFADYQLKVGEDPAATIDAAEGALERGLELDPDRIGLLSAASVGQLMRGQLHLRSGVDPSTALRSSLEVAGRMLELFPDSAYALLTGGQAWLELARFELLHGRAPSAEAAQSRDWYERGLEKVPGLPGPRVELAEVALMEALWAISSGENPARHLEQAIKDADRAFEIDSSRADAVRARGEAELIQAVLSGGERDFRRARQTLDRSLELNEKDVDTHIVLARWSWRRHEAGLDVDVSGGLAAAREARRLHPRNMRALALEGALLTLDSTTRAEGLGKLEEAVQRNPNLAREWHQLAADLGGG